MNRLLVPLMTVVVRVSTCSRSVQEESTPSERSSKSEASSAIRIRHQT